MKRQTYSDRSSKAKKKHDKILTYTGKFRHALCKAKTSLIRIKIKQSSRICATSENIRDDVFALTINFAQKSKAGELSKRDNRHSS